MLADKVERPIQESLLTLMVFSDEKGGTIAKLLEPELFDGDYEEIARGVGRYWAKYNRAPKHQVDEIFAHIFHERTGRDITYGNLFAHMLQLYEGGLNHDFLLDTVHRFRRAQKFKRLAMNGLQQLQAQGEDALDDIDRELDAYRQHRVEGVSKRTTLYEVDAILGSLRTASQEFSTGIEQLDRGYVVPMRKELMLALGVSGTGKSWLLIHLAKRAMLRRRKVLYVTCEMSEQAVGARFYQALLGVPRRSVDSVVTRLALDRNERLPGLSGLLREEVETSFSLLGSSAELELTVRLRRFEQVLRNLVIRGYSSGQLTPGMLEAVIDEEAVAHNFVPDMVIVDYIGIMNVNRDKMRESLGYNAVTMRGIAQSRNMAMVTAQQVSREGKNVQEQGRDVDIQHTAEDWSLIATSDVALTLSQTKLEAELGLMRILTAKVRNEQSRYTVLCTQDYTRGQFALQSMRIPSQWTKLVKEFGDAQDKEATNRTGNDR